MADQKFRNVVFTLNNPVGLIPFDEERMRYLVYQEEIGDAGTLHLQGYCELREQERLNAVKALLGGDQNVHIERRRGSAQQAINYAKKDETRVGGPYEYGEPANPGKRTDLKKFKDAVMAGKRKRELVDDHYSVLARHPKFYDTLNMLNRPKRQEPLEVHLLYGETGTGKTKSVMDAHEDDDDFYPAPLNNGTMWYDTFDGHRKVLLDDFAGASSHISLVSLLRLLDRYAVMVPTKGSHTWWLPTQVYITTNILPRDWYKWEKRGEQYKALARRFTHVKTFYYPLQDSGEPTSEATFYEEDPHEWFKENAPQEAINLYN